MVSVGFDIEKAALIMEKLGIDALIAHSPENIFYTTGMPTLSTDVNPIWFWLRNIHELASIITREGEQTLITSWHFSTMDARTLSWVKDVRVAPSNEEVTGLLGQVLRERRLDKGRIGVENRLPFGAYLKMKNEFREAQFVDAEGVFYDLRLMKSSEEIRRLKKATDIAEAAVRAAMGSLGEGVRFSEILREMKLTIMKEGGWSWPHVGVYAFGKHGRSLSSQPGRPEYVLRRGDIVIMDLGAAYEGYASDIRRVASVGEEPPQEVMRLYEKLRDATETCKKAIRPGVSVSHVYDVARKILLDGGYTSNFGNGGHSIGIEFEEPPFIEPKVNVKFEPNMVFTLELTLPLGDIRVSGPEEIVVVTNNGNDQLTTLDNKIQVCR